MNAATVFRRARIILSGGASRVVASLFNVIVSWAVIRFQSPAAWGGIVQYILILDFAFSIISWGATPYLLRSFSFQPATIKKAWSESTVSRVVLLLLFLPVLIFLDVPPIIKTYLAAWAIFRFVYHAFESVLQFERAFLFSILLELGAVLIIAVPIFLDRSLGIAPLLLLFTLSMAWKALASCVCFRTVVAFHSFSARYFLNAFPFVLLTFSAMLQQRMDIYWVSYFSADQDLARYQVFINLLIFSQFVGGLLLSPFAKNIFRLPHVSFLKLERKFILLGIPLSLLALVTVYVVVEFMYALTLPFSLYALGFFYILSFFVYLPRNYELGKLNMQTRAALFSLAGSGVNMVLSYLLIPGMGLYGAMLGATIGQVLIAVLYHIKTPTRDVARR